jgi:hypothetical protein
LEGHHIKPFHLFPELEMDESNWITLIRPWHFYLGHLRNWHYWNPEVVTMADQLRRLFGKFRGILGDKPYLCAGSAGGPIADLLRLESESLGEASRRADLSAGVWEDGVVRSE